VGFDRAEYLVTYLPKWREANRERLRKKQRERRAELRRRGLCVHCGELSQWFSVCRSCREKACQHWKNRGGHRKRKVKERTSTWRRDYYRNYNAQRRASGLCTSCPNPSEKYWLCLQCRLRKRKYRARADRNSTQNERRMAS
jgi:hypothetical protein